MRDGERAKANENIERMPSVRNSALLLVFGFNMPSGILKPKTKSKALLLTSDELVGTAFSFLVAGKATTTATVSWGLHTLAKNTDFQHHLCTSLLCDPSLPRGETVEFNGNRLHDEYFNAFARHALLDFFVKDMLRLFPSVNYIARTVDIDTDSGATIDEV